MAAQGRHAASQPSGFWSFVTVALDLFDGFGLGSDQVGDLGADEGEDDDDNELDDAIQIAGGPGDEPEAGTQRGRRGRRPGRGRG